MPGRDFRTHLPCRSHSSTWHSLSFTAAAMSGSTDGLRRDAMGDQGETPFLDLEGHPEPATEESRPWLACLRRNASRRPVCVPVRWRTQVREEPGSGQEFKWRLWTPETENLNAPTQSSVQEVRSQQNKYCAYSQQPSEKRRDFVKRNEQGACPCPFDGVDGWMYRVKERLEEHTRRMHACSRSTSPDAHVLSCFY